MANNKQEEFVLSLDVGTTNIRAFIYDQTGAIRGHDNDKVSAKFWKLDMYVQVSKYLLKKFLNPFCFACTYLGVFYPPQSQMSTAKWQSIAGSKNFFSTYLFLNIVSEWKFFLN